MTVSLTNVYIQLSLIVNGSEKEVHNSWNVEIAICPGEKFIILFTHMYDSSY